MSYHTKQINIYQYFLAFYSWYVKKKSQISYSHEERGKVPQDNYLLSSLLLVAYLSLLRYIFYNNENTSKSISFNEHFSTKIIECMSVVRPAAPIRYHMWQYFLAHCQGIASSNDNDNTLHKQKIIIEYYDYFLINKK